jgi:hypothetical protein
MFEQTFVEGTAKTHKTWTVLLSFMAQVAAVIVLILIPLIYTDTLPRSSKWRPGSLTPANYWLRSRFPKTSPTLRKKTSRRLRAPVWLAVSRAAFLVEPAE